MTWMHTEGKQKSWDVLFWLKHLLWSYSKWAKLKQGNASKSQVNKCLCPFPLLSHWIFINNFSFIYFECRLSLMICTEALLYCRESIEKRVSTLNCCGRKFCRHYTSSPAWTEYWSAKSCHNSSLGTRVKSLNCRRFVSIMLYSSHAQNAGR